MTQPTIPDERLHLMLSYKRPHGTHTELAWAEHFIDPYNPQLFGNTDTMAYVVTVGQGATTLFSAHVDTVHAKEGMQKVYYNPATKIYSKRDSEPLGADDAAGCWLLLEMIDAGVPGTYIFHRGEEKGGIGSSWMAKHEQDFLGQFKRAIAFDRRGVDSVITHQMRGRCCSDTFATVLAMALNDANDDLALMYSPDETGVYTDTAEYISIIPECTNVSCGYNNEHSGQETLNVAHLLTLRDALLKVNWEALPTERDPATEPEYESRYYTRSPSSAYYNEPFSLYELTREDLEELAYSDPELLVDLVCKELGLDDPKDDRANNLNDPFYWRDEYRSSTQ